ncbi:hypothetical protein [Paenibacillus sp. EZ-K15]|uniref:hypothetical protein n=1 Tax=Paenibacillus sp. EZ-K15 TaxID=2044275 RepID=UPI0012907036|nr:hypothetical protein [Paenibacillus sp. EZ-K15]
MYKLPILCAGITDNDPPKEKIEVLDEKGEPALNRHGKPIVDLQEVYPTPSKLLKGANSALELEDDKQKIVWGRLYSFPLKTFEYDLLMEGNISKMAEVLQKFWLTDKGSVNSTCSAITDIQLLNAAIKAQIPNMETPVNVKWDEDDIDKYSLLDFVEFCYSKINDINESD